LRGLTFTLFRNATDTHGTPITLSWGEWQEQYFSHHEVRGQPSDANDEIALKKHKNGPALILGDMPPGSSHANKNVLSVHALGIDVDGQPADAVDRALKALESFEWCAWTTHRHGAASAHGLPKFRIVLPLVEPLDPKDHARAWLALNALVGGINDPTTKNIGRLFYLPSSFDVAVAEVFHHPGRWLSFLEDLKPEAEVVRLPAQTAGLAKLRKQLRATPRDDELKDAIVALLAGKAFAEAPHRHATILALTFRLAILDQGLSAAEIEELFTPSLAVMRAADETSPPMIDAVNAYTGAVKKIQDSEAQRKLDKRARILEEQAKATGQGRYTPDDLKRIASANGWAPEELGKRWIVQQGGSCWLLSETGDYVGPFSRYDVPVGLSQVLARAPVQLVEASRNGTKYRAAIDVVRENGTAAAAVYSDLTIRRTRFDPATKILHEAVCPVRNLTPAFDPEIDKWLKVMAGGSYAKLVDWMACAPDLNKLLCAIYFAGAPSSGKTLFATGLAKIWTEGSPGSIERVLSAFNDEVVRCPLILADEEIPRSYHNTATAVLRSMLSTVERTLARKYQPTSSLRGAVRLVLTSNSEALLNAEISSSQDLEAIAQRFLYIDVPPKAAELLNELPRSQREAWAQEGIAKHALWLAANHNVAEPGKRFWVEGSVGDMTNRLLGDSKWNSLTIEWLVRYLMNPKMVDSKGGWLIRRGEHDGELLVNDQAVVDYWSLYLLTREAPITSFIGSALRAISKTPRVKREAEIRESDGTYTKKQLRYRVIEVEHLLNWAERFGLSDRDTLVKAVSYKQYLARIAEEEKAKAQARN